MKEEVLNEFVKLMTETLKEAKGFTLEQMPIVCKEILTYNYAVSIMYAVIFGVVILAALLVIYFFHRCAVTEKEPEYYGIAAFIGGMLLIVGSIGTSSNVQDAIKIKTAPRVYLIEYFSKLVVRK